MSRMVYFMRPVGMEGPVKIGCSWLPAERLEQLAVWSPFPLEVVAAVPGNFALELNIHQCLADLHSHHEWFRADPKISAIIAKLQAGVAIGDAMDLTDRQPSTKYPQYCSPETRKHRRYAIGLSAAARKLSTETHWFDLPADVNRVLRRWCKTGRGAEGRWPTDAEFARMDAVLADPSAHCVPHDRFARAA